MATFKSFGPDILKKVISDLNTFCESENIDIISWEVLETTGGLYTLVLCCEPSGQAPKVHGFRLQQ